MLRVLHYLRRSHDQILTASRSGRFSYRRAAFLLLYLGDATMNKHTPGPWAVDASKSFYVFGPARLSEQAGLTHGPFVCNASSQANAQLIAAAPAMLLRLQQAVIANDNVFDVLMEAVRVCSLGQITNALFEVGGQYRRNM